jgi:hypothetical protein
MKEQQGQKEQERDQRSWDVQRKEKKRRCYRVSVCKQDERSVS